MKVIVVVPTYNEASNLPALVEALSALAVPELETLVVDDNSPDGTGRVADELALAHADSLHVLHRPGKGGLGTAYLEGFQWALSRGAEAVAQMDADFSHSPSYIPAMIANLRDYDVVIGSRYVAGGTLDKRWGLGRYLLSWWANSVYARILLNVKVKDATAGFKVWRRETLLGMGLDRIHSNGYDFQVEMAYVAERLGYRALEIPIYFEDRRIGRSKMDVPVKLEAAWRVWEVRWRHRNLNPTMRRPVVDPAPPK
ncbi:MAG: polyprenol monophosphomannose synthase [Chloroflexi bacterium]|nr:polyprenol monophosphomannose synthase [Chloroflexota bacterium]